MNVQSSQRSHSTLVHAPLVLDHYSPVPLYHQLAEQLTTAIHEGVLQPGDHLEGEVALSERLDISRPTVRRSISQLVSQGLVVRRRGAGTTVAHRTMPRRGDNASLFDDLRAAGMEPTTNVLRLAFGQIDHRAATALHVDQGTPLVVVERLRLVNGTPLALLRNWLALPL